MFWQISHINVLYCNDYKAYSNISMVIFLCHVFISYILYDEDNSVAILQAQQKKSFLFLQGSSEYVVTHLSAWCYSHNHNW